MLTQFFYAARRPAQGDSAREYLTLLEAPRR